MCSRKILLLSGNGVWLVHITYHLMTNMTRLSPSYLSMDKRWTGSCLHYWKQYVKLRTCIFFAYKYGIYNDRTQGRFGDPKANKYLPSSIEISYLQLIRYPLSFKPSAGRPTVSQRDMLWETNLLVPDFQKAPEKYLYGGTRQISGTSILKWHPICITHTQTPELVLFYHDYVFGKGDR